MNILLKFPFSFIFPFKKIFVLLLGTSMDQWVLDSKKGPGPNSFWVHNEIAWIIYSGSKKKQKWAHTTRPLEHSPINMVRHMIG